MIKDDSMNQPVSPEHKHDHAMTTRMVIKAIATTPMATAAAVPVPRRRWCN
jgi:hypothetical protein